MPRTTGYCTHAFHLRSKSLRELEDLLGYGRDRLASGATILFLEELPAADDFQLAGYNYFSDGTVEGHKLAPEARGPYRMEALLKTEQGWSDMQLRAYKQKMQVRIIRPLEFRVKATVAPGERWLGDYL